MPAGIQSLEIDKQNRLYTTYQSSQSASGKGFYLLFAENGIFNDTLLIYDITPEYVTRNSSQVITNGNGDIAMFYAPGAVRNGDVIADIFMKRGNIYNVVPVELVSFNTNVSGNDIMLNWTTATETNNYGFDVQRLQNSNSERLRDWEKVGFVKGRGTTTEVQNYKFTDYDLSSGKYSYRLKQIDFDGTFSYSNVIEVDVRSLDNFTLEQNYPNPFNPSATIKYSIPENGFVSIKVYDVLGKEVALVVNEEKAAGHYEVAFDASRLSSGVYFYRLTTTPVSGQTENFSSTRKMILAK